MAVPKNLRSAKFSINGWEIVPLPQAPGDPRILDLGAGASKPMRITCIPTPCKGGYHHVPDWWDITEFG